MGFDVDLNLAAVQAFERMVMQIVQRRSGLSPESAYRLCSIDWTCA